jgi:hypothetical protein
MGAVLQSLTLEGSSLVLSSLSRRASSYALKENVKSKASLRIVSFVAKQICIAVLFNKAFESMRGNIKFDFSPAIIVFPTAIYLVNELQVWASNKEPIKGFDPDKLRGLLSRYEKVVNMVIYIGFYYIGSKVTAGIGLSYMVYVEIKNNTEWVSSKAQRVLNAITGIADLCIIGHFGSKVLLAELFVMKNLPAVLSEVPARSNIEKRKGRFNPSWGTNLVAEAEQGKLFPCLGREEIVQEMKATLLQDRINNPVLTGLSGAGKTSIVHALAQQIADGAVEDEFKDCEIIEVSLNNMMKDAKYVGTLNKAVVVLEEAAAKNPNLIFFIDEIHNIVGQGKTIKSSTDILEMLKAALGKDTFRVIGATTPEEFDIIKGANAAERRFTVINVPQLSKEEARNIILGAKSKYEKDYACVITEEAVTRAVDLGFESGMLLPGSALTLLSKAAARVMLSDRSAKKNDGVRPTIWARDIKAAAKVESRGGGGAKITRGHVRQGGMTPEQIAQLVDAQVKLSFTRMVSQFFTNPRGFPVPQKGR